MSRKILKILISLLFLAAAAVTAVFSIKSFFPRLWNNQEKPNSFLDFELKYGVGPIQEEERVLPTIDKDGFPIQENRMLAQPIEPNSSKDIERKHNGELPIVMPIVMDINTGKAVVPNKH